MSLVGNAARLLVIAAALLGALASSSSQGPEPAAPSASDGAPPSQPMDPAMATGLWKSSFGPVKIDADETGGPSAVVGVWTYDRQGQQVVGYFQGALDGNVLRFSWHEPAQPYDLVGEGWLAFDVYGRRFDGTWWTRSRDRGGPFTAERSPSAPAPAPAGPVAPQPGQAEQAPTGGPPVDPPPESI